MWSAATSPPEPGCGSEDRKRKARCREAAGLFNWVEGEGIPVMKLMIALALAAMPLPVMAQATADTPGHSQAGVQLIQPKGWSADSSGPVSTFVAPESDL